MVIYPKTRAASCLYGKGTQWCTAAKKNSSFSYYNSQGKLYIIINKRNGRKYQFHAESDSFMDETDRRITEYFYKSVTDGLFNYLIKEIPCLEDDYHDSLVEKIKMEDEDAKEKARRSEDINYLSTYFGSYPYLPYGTFYHQCRYFYVATSAFEKYKILYESQNRVLIGLEFEADYILPLFDFFRDEVLIIRRNNKGIYNINSDTVRWGYKGNIDKSIVLEKLFMY